jgi:hypothetical protein
MIRTVQYQDPRHLLPGLAIAMILLLSRPSHAETYELRYSFRPGDSFDTTVQLTSQGTIFSPTASASFSMQGQILRRYQVTGMEPGRVAILEPALDSASFEISVGTSAVRVFLTPVRMEINGMTVWDREECPASGQIMPFLDPSPIRLDSLGRHPSRISQRHRLRYEQPFQAKGGRHIGLEVFSLFGGEVEIFPPLPEAEVQTGNSWRARVILGRAVDESAAMIRDGTFTLVAPEGLEGKAVEIRSIERITAADSAGIVVYDQVQPPEEDESKPTPTPRIAERDKVQIERLNRSLEGRYRFDTEWGLPLSAELAGTEQIETTMTHRYQGMKEVYPLSYSLDLELRVRFQYPRSGDNQ